MDDTDSAKKFVDNDVVANPLLLLRLLVVVTLPTGLEITVVVLVAAYVTDDGDTVAMVKAVLLPEMPTEASTETTSVAVVVDAST